MSDRNLEPVVHAVDDDAAFLVSVSRLLRASGYSVSTHSCAADLLEHAGPRSSGCVIVDLKMPGVGGLDLQEQLVHRGCTMPVIFLTGCGDIPSTVQAMRHGAEDFLTKLAPKELLFEAVDRALERDRRQRQQLTQVQSARDRLALLTPREREVLEHVLNGEPNKQIASALSIHERTVKLHRTSITTKLGVQSVAELCHLAHEASP